MHMNRDNRADQSWRSTHPFSVMLLNYQDALDTVTQRIAELRALAKEQMRADSGVPQAEQLRLEKRILVLKEERAELCEDIRSIREYAEREISWGDEISRE